MTALPLPLQFLRALQPRLPEMLGVLRRFVTTESPSLKKAAADRCCTAVAQAWRKPGARLERIAQKHRGDHLRVTFAPGQSPSAGQLLVLGHYDTVYATGTLEEMPFRISGS